MGYVADTSSGAKLIAELQFYESTSPTDVTVSAVFSRFRPVHSDDHIRIAQCWDLGTQYPAVGKSSVARGYDVGETNPPAPSGVFDLAFHTGNEGQAVARFEAPIRGTYSVRGIALRYVLEKCGEDGVVFRIYSPSQAIVYAQQSSAGTYAWEPSVTGDVLLGKLDAGQSIYFAMDGIDDIDCDSVEVAWSIEALRP